MLWQGGRALAGSDEQVNLPRTLLLQQGGGGGECACVAMAVAQ